MARILISHPMAKKTIEKLELQLIDSNQKNPSKIGSIKEDIYYGKKGKIEILYIPNIALKQQPKEQVDPSLKILTDTLITWCPDVLIVGNNAAPGFAIDAWRKEIGENRRLLIIRRGVDTRAIDKVSAAKNQVFVDNLPGVNSPYVAQHMMKILQLDNAVANSKIGIIGVGNIGIPIAKKSIEKGLKTYLFSPSLQDPKTRLSSLHQKGIPPEKVVCVEEIEEVFQDANYIAISIPWENFSGGYNRDIISHYQIKDLAKNAMISSVSVPRIFSQEALSLMNNLIQQNKLYVRIDTAKRRAVETKLVYPDIDACHDIAFSAPECQQELDRVMLQKSANFLGISWDL